MIFTNRKITISGDKASMDKPIVLYRGDREVEIQFEIVYEVVKYRATNAIESSNASFGQLVMQNKSAAILTVTNISPTNEGVVIFKFTKEMIDELTELGPYNFQIRLFDDTQTSRITIPVVENSIIIKEPLSIYEGEREADTAEVGLAFTGAAKVQQEEYLEPFDKTGNYNETTWATGDIITSGRLNKLEDGITGVNQKIDSQIKDIENEISKPISLNKCDSEMLGAIQNKEGETNFNLLSIPRNNSVSVSKLDSLLQSLIKVSSSNIELTVVPGYIWDFDNGCAWRPTGDSNYRGCEQISVNPGEEYVITGRSVWNANLYVIKDANDNILEIFPNVSATGKNYDNIKIIIPDKGATLCMNSWIDYPTVLKKITDVEINYNKINSLKDDFVQYNNLDDKLKYIYKEQYESVNLTFVDGGYYQYNTGLIHEHTDFQNCKISVKANERYKISGATSYEANLYIITDSNNNIITVFPNTNEGGKTYENIEFSIPSNGKNLLINQRLSRGKTILQKKVYNIKQAQNGLKWCAFGDSLTDSAILGETNYNYTNFVSKNLGLTLTNCGKGGTGYLANNNNSGLPFWQRVNTIPSDTDILTIFGSFNDMFVSDYNLGTINDTGTNTVYGAIKKMVTEAFKVNDKIRVALITPTPWSGRWRGNSTNGENVIKYVQAIIDVANYYSIPCLNLFDCSNLRPWDNAFNSKYYLNADGTHPNTEGHKFIAPKIENFIKSIIQNYN